MEKVAPKAELAAAAKPDPDADQGSLMERLTGDAMDAPPVISLL